MPKSGFMAKHRESNAWVGIGIGFGFGGQIDSR
jgi:hypothetical protein